MSLEQAEKRCEHFKKLKEQIYQAKKCPKCGEHTLEIEGGSYEEGIKPYVYCENNKVKVFDGVEEYEDDCDFSSKITKEFEFLNSYCDFDVALAFVVDIQRDGFERTEKNIGCSWNEFIEKDTLSMV